MECYCYSDIGNNQNAKKQLYSKIKSRIGNDKLDSGLLAGFGLFGLSKIRHHYFLALSSIGTLNSSFEV